eukprot:2499134-Prymnesium_polylepis.2
MGHRPDESSGRWPQTPEGDRSRAPEAAWPEGLRPLDRRGGFGDPRGGVARPRVDTRALRVAVREITGRLRIHVQSRARRDVDLGPLASPPVG